MTDDPSLPTFTFRVWVLGCVSCVLLMFVNTFFSYRTQPLTISGILAQFLVLPIGKFMEATLPTKKLRVPYFGWEWGVNPGPFNMKEHVLITIFANSGVSYGGGDAYSIGAINVMKAFYKQNVSFIATLIIVLTTQPLSQLRNCGYPILDGAWSVNPGPFNMKEHVLITIFANSSISYGGGDAYSIGEINVMKAFYKQNVSFIATLIIVPTTQVLGYGWAGLLRKYLVDPADMWWPSNLAQISLFRAVKVVTTMLSKGYTLGKDT